jgi:hypothetical protein
MAVFFHRVAVFFNRNAVFFSPLTPLTQTDTDLGMSNK